jgi:hypothetical protein
VPAIDRSEGISAQNPVSFGEDSCHRLYVASGNGVYRLQGASPAVCPAPPEEAPPEEEAPSEGKAPPASGAPPALSQTATPGAAAGETGEHPVVRLRGRRVGRRLVLSVRVSPCAAGPGERVRLNRGGETIGSRQLRRGCTARFALAAPEQATFRALLEAADGRIYRSQVLKIALAKPTP